MSGPGGGGYVSLTTQGVLVCPSKTLMHRPLKQSIIFTVWSPLRGSRGILQPRGMRTAKQTRGCTYCVEARSFPLGEKDAAMVERGTGLKSTYRALACCIKSFSVHCPSCRPVSPQVCPTAIFLPLRAPRSRCNSRRAMFPFSWDLHHDRGRWIIPSATTTAKTAPR